MTDKTIDLCGIGNGLVDLQYEIPNAKLEEMQVNKGEMCLIEPEKQMELVSKLQDRNHNKCSGGSAANTIIAFTKFGGTAAYQTALGNDDYGKFYAQEFESLGIKLVAPFLDSDSTGTCLVLITPDSERTMMTALGATGKFGIEHLNHELITQSKWIYLEGYKFTAQSSTDALFEALKVAKESDTKIALTFSDVFIVNVFRQNLTEVVKNSDLIFCNETEAKAFTNCDDVDEAFKSLCESCPNVVMTMNDKGSLVFWDGKKYEIPSYPTKPIDTTGAGDMYAGGFLYGIIHTGNPELAGHLGSYSAAKVVSQLGARLDEDHIRLRNYIIEKF